MDKLMVDSGINMNYTLSRVLEKGLPWGISNPSAYPNAGWLENNEISDIIKKISNIDEKKSDPDVLIGLDSLITIYESALNNNKDVLLFYH